MVKPTAILLLSACSFSAPSVPGAKQSCIDWFDACRSKAISCGLPLEKAEATYEEWVPTCDAVVYANTDTVYQDCIPRELGATCEQSLKETCAAFVRTGQ